MNQSAAMEGAGAVEVVEKPLKPGANVPVALPGSAARLAPLMLLNGLLLAAVLTLMVTLYKPQWLGISQTSGLALKDIRFDEQKEGEHGRVILGAIVNTSKQEKILPVIRISLVDEKKTLIKDPWYEPQDQRVLKPDESFSFKTRPLEMEEKGGAHVVVEVGNPLELLLRRAKLWAAK